MSNWMTSAAAGLVFVLAAQAAQAVTVTIGSTLVGDAGGINAQGAAVSIASSNAAYSSEVTTPASEWVWVGNVQSVNAAVFEFIFDLTGYDFSTATIAGRWGVDNAGTVSLNGNLLATLSGNASSNYRQLHDYGTSNDAFFNAGQNILTFSLIDNSGPASFRATAIVEADLVPMSAVPLPASALLMLAGLGGIAALRRKR